MAGCAVLLLHALHARGIAVANRDGLCLLVPVEAEQFAMVTMAARCIAVFPGARFCINRIWRHICFSSGVTEQNVEAVAEAIALAARVG